MKFKAYILSCILVIFFSLGAYESFLRLKRGAPPRESDLPNFNYNYVDIHNKYIKEEKLPDGNIICKLQRRHSSGKIFLLNKEQGTRRIFVIGGSVGSMFNNTLLFQHLLKGLVPDLRFELIDCWMGGYDSYRSTLVFFEVMNYSPDLIIVMDGNNEMYSPVKLNLFLYRSNKLLRSLWFYRDLQNTVLKLVKFHKITQEERLRSFKNNLTAMVRAARKRDIDIALCTLPVNFRDCPPNYAPLPLEEKDFFRGWYNLNEGNMKAAEASFKQFLDKYPEDGYANYFIARCYDISGHYSRAKEHYLKALALDTNPGDRCTPQRNAAIRELCDKEGAILLDLEKTFLDIAPNGLLGNNFFVDNCHWWSDYYPLIMTQVITTVCKLEKYRPINHACLEGDLSSFKHYKGDFLSEEDSTEEKSLSKVLYAFVSCARNLQDMEERTPSYLKSAFDFNRKIFKDKAHLKKYILENLANNFWTKDYLLDFNSVWVKFLYYIGETNRRCGCYDEAIEHFNDSICLVGDDSSSPTLSLSLVGRALAYYKKGRAKEAMADILDAQAKSKKYPWIKFYKEELKI
jgi:tetratricopeptide (TPR) repeat protein